MLGSYHAGWLSYWVVRMANILAGYRVATILSSYYAEWLLYWMVNLLGSYYAGVAG